MIYKHVEIEVSLDDFDDKDLIDELEKRDLGPMSHPSACLLTTIYEKRRLHQDYQQELDELIYSVIGKIV